MKKREERLQTEINAHMAKVKQSINFGMPFAVDEYCCLICNAYFSKDIVEEDFEIIRDIIKYLTMVGSLKNVSVLQKILADTDNLKKNMKDVSLQTEFHPVMPDELKNKLRSLHKNKPNKYSRVHTLKGSEYDNFYAKYARDLDSNWMRNIQRFTSLKLKKSSKMLDIGCGFGLFSQIATVNDHDVISIDMPNASPILKEAAKILKIKKYDFEVKKKSPFLKFEHKFDVVTALQIFFNGHCTKDLWDVDDWKYFLMDLHDNILNDGGSVVLGFNMEHNNLKPIEIDGEVVALGKKSLEVFFEPFFIKLPNMPASANKVTAILTKDSIKKACETNIFLKRSFTINTSKTGKYGS